MLLCAAYLFAGTLAWTFVVGVATRLALVAVAMGTQGWGAAVWPGSAGGPAGRIWPVGQGCRSRVGRRSFGRGGASTTSPFNSSLTFEPGHA